MNRARPDIVTIVMCTCAIIVTGLVVKRELAPIGPRDSLVALKVVEAWESYAGVGRKLGKSGSQVPDAILFSDFQCPFCAQAARALGEVLREFPEASVEYRHYPLESIHPAAVQAAEAAECAGEQGAFSAMHDVLFANQAVIKNAEWQGLAAKAGVADLRGFAVCMEASRYARRVQEDIEVASSLGISGTPSFLIDGKLFVGADAVERLERDLKKKERGGSGTP